MRSGDPGISACCKEWLIIQSTARTVLTNERWNGKHNVPELLAALLMRKPYRIVDIFETTIAVKGHILSPVQYILSRFRLERHAIALSYSVRGI